MMKSVHRVKEDQNLIRDSQSGAILQTDRSAFLQRKEKKKEVDRIRTLENRIEQLETIVNELRGMIRNAS